MAQTAAALKAAPEPAVAPAKKSGKKGLILIIAVVMVLLGGGAGGWVWWQKQHEAPAKGGKDAKKDKADAAPPTFINIDQMVVNLAGGEHYLQVAMVLSVANGEAGEVIKTYMPVIRNKVLLLLSSKTAEDLAKPEAKQQLAEEILAQTREVLPPAKGDAEDKGIQAVLFSNFIIQ
jgi:flagellar FliL protein